MGSALLKIFCTSDYIMTDSGKKFDSFIDIVRELRSAKGCPWDREQTPLSLKRYILEETHELLEAIDESDHQHVKEELGDLLYLIILQAQIHNEEGFFTISDVIDTISSQNGTQASPCF